MTAGTTAPLVVFDLDGVIARTDTMAFMLQRQLVSHPLRAVAGAVPAALWFLLHRYPSARPRLSRALGRAALSGLSASKYAQLAREVGALIGADPARRIPDGLSAIRRHLAAGDEVVITTGTEFTLARAFLDSLDLTGVELVATDIRFDHFIVRYENHNLGSGKVSGFSSREIDLFYTDSDLDLALAKLSRHTVLVNPSERLAGVFRAHISDLEIVRWD
jgi:phosphatidylglycerophosphatase C